MLQVSEILRVKGNTLYTASPEAQVVQALETMSAHDIGSLVIMDQGKLAGMLTFREIIRHVNGNHGAVGATPIRAIMESSPVSVTPDTDASTLQRLMLDNHCRYVPVMDDGVLLGVISFYDLAQAIVAAQKFENSMLKAYIRDWPADKASPKTD